VLLDVLRLLNAEADATVKRRVVIALAVVMAGGLLAALAPLALKGLVDAVAGGRSASHALISSAAAFGAAYLLALCGGRLLAEIQPLVYGKAEQRLNARLSRRFLRHLLDLRLEFHLSRRTGALVQTLSQATMGCELLMLHMVNSIVPVAVEVVTVAIVLMHLDQPVLVTIFVATAAVYLLIFSTSMFQLTEKARAVSGASLNTHAALTDGVLNYETIKYFNAEASVRERYANATTDLETTWGRLYWQRVKMGLAIAATFTVSVAASLTVAADAVSAGTLTIGGFVLANVYMLQIARPLEMLGAALRDVSQALGFVRPFLDVLKEPTEEMHAGLGVRSDTTHSKDGYGVAAEAAVRDRLRRSVALRFEGVFFGYDADRPVLNNLDLDIAAGRTVAIVGSSGAGKSSLVRLILRLYEPQRGRILFGQTPINELHTAVLRSAIGLVPQDTVLFNDTIAFNIGIGKPGASRMEIERAACVAHLHEFIAALPNGYDTLVGERGLKLSGGERQRIAIARAVIKSPKLFVFDEATSSLDSQTEAAIIRNLREVSAGCTTIMIAHRLSTVLHADEIVVLRNGRVAERGVHAELLQSDGAYAKLWRAQLPKRVA
jgi:ABC-type transport system involved in Fe-S cluster assembly fused permease/ATPase subunit